MTAPLQFGGSFGGVQAADAYSANRHYTAGCRGNGSSAYPYGPPYYGQFEKLQDERDDARADQRVTEKKSSGGTIGSVFGAMTGGLALGLAGLTKAPGLGILGGLVGAGLGLWAGHFLGSEVGHADGAIKEADIARERDVREQEARDGYARNPWGQYPGGYSPFMPYQGGPGIF